MKSDVQKNVCGKSAKKTKSDSATIIRKKGHSVAWCGVDLRYKHNEARKKISDEKTLKFPKETQIQITAKLAALRSNGKYGVCKTNFNLLTIMNLAAN